EGEVEEEGLAWYLDRGQGDHGRKEEVVAEERDLKQAIATLTISEAGSETARAGTLGGADGEGIAQSPGAKLSAVPGGGAMLDVSRALYRALMSVDGQPGRDSLSALVQSAVMSGKTTLYLPPLTPPPLPPPLPPSLPPSQPA
ncbi:hypothetical protein Naga_101657g1, partial [Nannochloropsis gaditana]